MGEHIPGKMNIREQEKTFMRFIKMTIWGCLLIVAVLVFMALANA